MTDGKFAEMLELAALKPAGQYPFVSYDEDGDCIEFIVKGVSHYAKRIDALTTIYHSQENDEVVGSFIKGVRKFLREQMTRSPGFAVEITDGRIRLTHIFTAKMWSSGAKTPELFIYKVLRDKADKGNVEVELGDFAPCP
jgi:hypothetical protein